MTKNEFRSKIDEIRLKINEIVEKINTGQCARCPEPRCSSGNDLSKLLNDILPYLLKNDKSKHRILSKRFDVLFDERNHRINPYSFGAIVDIINLIKAEIDEEQEITTFTDSVKLNNEFKINSLYINDFYILKDFEITFSEGLNLMIGENGSGKSTILETIALIFGHLYKYFIESDEKAPFIEGYKISFTSRNPATDLLHMVTIISNYCKTNDYRFDPKITIDGGEVAFDKNAKNLIKNLLPSKIVLYYAGITDHLKELSGHFENRYESRVTKSGNEYSLMPLNLPAPRPFMYTRNEHLGIFLLCLLLNYEDNSSLVKDLKIDPLDIDVTFEFKKPKWAKKDVNEFWGAEGELTKQLLSLLIQEAYNKSITEEHINATHPLEYIRNEFARIFNFDVQYKAFEVFDFLLFNGLLKQINLTWKVNDDYVELDRMSEGEKQLLTIKAISTLWQNKRSLLLLDEPDTFLHPKWQREYINDLNKNNKTNTIITSHNPAVVGSLDNHQIKIIVKGCVIKDDKFTFGRDINSILSDLFGIDERSKEGKDLLIKFYKAMDDKDYSMAESVLKAINNKFGRDDITSIKLNMMFDDFV